MLDRIVHLFRRPTHEPEVQESQREQLREFDVWATVKDEVKRVEKLVERRANGRPR